MNPELHVLHAVRLAGFGSTSAVAERAGLDAKFTERHAESLQRAGLVERFAFAGDAGWVLTEAGRDRDAAAVQSEVADARAAKVLESAADRFEEVNGRFVQVVTAWQLSTDDAEAGEVLDALEDIAGELTELLAPVVVVLPRFGRYPQQLWTAIDRAAAGELDWLSGVGLLSAHTVWAELHQDLLTSLGRERGA